jgi:hypothetical protein
MKESKKRVMIMRIIIAFMLTCFIQGRDTEKPSSLFNSRKRTQPALSSGISRFRNLDTHSNLIKKNSIDERKKGIKMSHPANPQTISSSVTSEQSPPPSPPTKSLLLPSLLSSASPPLSSSSSFSFDENLHGAPRFMDRTNEALKKGGSSKGGATSKGGSKGSKGGKGGKGGAVLPVTQSFSCSAGGQPAIPGVGLPTFSDKQACVACKFVWSRINNVASKPSTPDLVGQSFDDICAEAPDVFYEGCDAMYDQIGFMIKDSMAGASMDQICGCAKICAPNTLGRR